MQVRSGRGSRGAHASHGLTGRDGHARLHAGDDPAEMGVEGGQALGMPHGHIAAVAALFTRSDDHAVGRDTHRNTGVGRDVDALVQATGAFPRQLAKAEGRHHRMAGDRLLEGDQDVVGGRGAGGRGGRGDPRRGRTVRQRRRRQQRGVGDRNGAQARGPDDHRFGDQATRARLRALLVFHQRLLLHHHRALVAASASWARRTLRPSPSGTRRRLTGFLGKKRAADKRTPLSGEYQNWNWTAARKSSSR